MPSPRTPVMIRLRLQMLTPASARCNWKRRISSVVAVSGERLEKHSKPLAAVNVAPLRASAELPCVRVTLRRLGLRRYCHCLQQLPQPALPQVSGHRRLAEREAELLPVGYFHLVFTLPGPIADIAYHNKAAIYGLLFTAAAEATMTIAVDPKRLGARIGITAVLHSWGSAMTQNPHS
jgi:hypothetical protein